MTKVYTLAEIRNGTGFARGARFMTVEAGRTPPAVRFIVHVVSSCVTGGGNQYHWARIASTMTGRSLCIKDTTESSAQALAQKACRLLGIESHWPAVYTPVTNNMSIRRFKATIPKDAIFEHEVTAEMVAALDTPEATET